MAQHIYARVSGHGLKLLPVARFHMRRRDDRSAVEVTHISPERPLRATVTLSNLGHWADTESDNYDVAQVVEISPGPPGPWRSETSKFLCVWPPQFAICSNPFPADPSPFDLLKAGRGDDFRADSSQNGSVSEPDGGGLNIAVFAPHFTYGSGPYLHSLCRHQTCRWLGLRATENLRRFA